MKIPANIQKAIQAYYAERATPEDVAALESWFRQDIAHLKVFAEHGMLEWQMLCEHEKLDAAAVLSILLEAEEKAEPDFSLLHTPSFETTSTKADDDALTMRKVWSAASYLMGQGLRSKAALYGSIAAVFVLGAALYLAIFGHGTTPESPDIADNMPSEPAEPAPPIPRGSNPVATLTATHNAQWGATPAERALARGSALRPGQRLTLTTGFAEITTAQGAIAVLEAPATIELLANDNALRLHAGKLVGICETDSSKGFLVRTPHMDVTDLGTRFGVDISDQDATEVHVFEGSVEVSRSAAGSNEPVSRVLLADQALRAEAHAQGFVDTQMQAERFAARPGNLLMGTGQGQAEGEIANNWRVVAVDGQLITQHGGMRIDPIMHDGSSDPATSQWLRINKALNPPGKGSAVFTCRSTVNAPTNVTPQTHELVIRCSADFSVKAVRVNGQSLPVPKNRIGVGEEWIALTVAEGFTPGENTIEIDVHEIFKRVNTANSSSLRVEVSARRR